MKNTLIVVMMLVGMAATLAVAQQNPVVIDLTAKMLPPPVPKAEESGKVKEFLADFTKDAGFETVESGHGTGLLPVDLTVQSVSPVSIRTKNIFVDLEIRNNGKDVLTIPVSRDPKILHVEGNQDRKVLSCALTLTSETMQKNFPNGNGFTTYSSSHDQNSVVKLKPGDAMVFRFVNSLGLDPLSAEWEKGIGDQMVVAGAYCRQQTLINRRPDKASGGRSYEVETSRGTSGNTVRLSLQP